MNQKELDSLLRIIENPVRRRIIKRLTQEPAYALQLSKELGLGQPLVAKHLTIMEKAGLVTSTPESSSTGPRRRRYTLTRGVSITMDVASNLFIERGATLQDHAPGGAGSTRVSTQLRSQVRDALSGQEDDKKKLSLLAGALRDLDARMSEIQEERMDLLGIRNRVMQEAATIAVKVEELDKRRVLFHILDEHDRRAESISESLNLRELAVRSILEELERDYFG